MVRPVNFFDLEPGTQAEWIGAIGTALGFAVAAGGYLWSVLRTRKAQARRVYAHIEKAELREAGSVDQTLDTQLEAGIIVRVHPESVSDYVGSPDGPMRRYLNNAIRLVVKIHNGSDEIMGPMRVELVDQAASQLFDFPTIPVGRVEPGDSVFVLLVLQDTWRPRVPKLRPRIVFRDSSGKWWHRYDSEPVHSAPRVIVEPTSPAEQLARELRWKRSPDATDQ